LKKVQRSFAIEYKSGRRKPDLKSNSIWGNLDLKSVARAVEKDASPFQTDSPQDGKSGDELVVPEAAQARSMLTVPLEQQTAVSNTQETIMVDENDTMTSTEALSDVDTTVVPKKQRKPRMKKGTHETTAAEPGGAPTGATGKQKRGRRPKSVEIANNAKRAPVRRTRKVVETALIVPTVVIDEMADLLQLEEENKRLRRLLAEKLRAENADLRKRLKLD
jgi:hypothetical protein